MSSPWFPLLAFLLTTSDMTSDMSSSVLLECMYGTVLAPPYMSTRLLIASGRVYSGLRVPSLLPRSTWLRLGCVFPER
uniref:Putative secreted protein n=1 Tax=Anopheles marajoara TaxID=58244 RepID=A0A2M4CCB2_9DIPT